MIVMMIVVILNKTLLPPASPPIITSILLQPADVALAIESVNGNDEDDDHCDSNDDGSGFGDDENGDWCFAVDIFKPLQTDRVLNRSFSSSFFASCCFCCWLLPPVNPITSSC